ncbi:MAG: hypothetical protein IJV65_01415 [Kiritimatiellae bacterium]|nr:hypothetical protein [Kiritimatiellia bacterium]
MKTKIDFRRIAGLALVAAAVALYARDCGRRQREEAALLAVRAMAADPGALVAFRRPSPGAPAAGGASAADFIPLRDAAAASNVVAALAAAERGRGGGAPHAASPIAEHDVLLLSTNRPPAFFHLRRSEGDPRVGVEPRNPADPFASQPADFPVLSAAGLADILKRVESGELLDTNRAVRFVVAMTVAGATNAPAAPVSGD